jgi:hypothetical protein
MLVWPSPGAAERTRQAKGVKVMLEKGDGIMSTYVGAVEDFRKSATAFMQHVDLLAQARDAYQQAMTASAELRTVLDAGDENLRTLMTQLEQALNLHMARPALDRKKPEPLKVEGIKANGESTGGIRAFP